MEVRSGIHVSALTGLSPVRTNCGARPSSARISAFEGGAASSCFLLRAHIAVNLGVGSRRRSITTTLRLNATLTQLVSHPSRRQVMLE